jgi:hypothetical protein
LLFLHKTSSNLNSWRPCGQDIEKHLSEKFLNSQKKVISRKSEKKISTAGLFQIFLLKSEYLDEHRTSIYSSNVDFGVKKWIFGSIRVCHSSLLCPDFHDNNYFNIRIFIFQKRFNNWSTNC